VMLDVNGERLEVVDSMGRRVTQMQVLAALAYLVFQQQKGAAVAVPVDAPSVFEALAAAHGGKVVRTRLDPQSLMSAATQKGVRMGGDGRGRTIFPALHPGFDAMLTIAKLLQFLSNARTTLHDVVAGLPPWHIKETNVPCSWEKKGQVMRMLGEQYRDRRVRASDGIKIQLGADWMLILPDPDEPQFHLVSEAQTDSEAEALLDKYSSIVTGLQT
jgi:mannose-1-phosphate guanylyltransferase/phosphomannomutase